MSLSVVSRVRIARAPHDVFEFIADPHNLPRWDPAIRAVRRTEEGPVGLGSGLTVTAVEAGRTIVLDTRVTDFEPGRVFGVSASYGGVPLTLRWRLEPEGEGTRVTAEGEAQLDGMLMLMAGLIKGLVAERLERAHANLKRLLER
jgi:uncharacterized protein YndB with AHSA1/START domain